MYLQHFGLKTNPFTLISDSKSMYYSQSHCEAMAHLLYGVRERKGLVLLIGEAGTGKTTLVHLALSLLQSTRVVSCAIFNPMLETAQQVLECVLEGFGISGEYRSPMEMTQVLQRHLARQAERGLVPVLFIDEAQQLQRETLEHIRLLSNLEADGKKLLQVVFAAQPEMSELLEDPKFAALRQRIVIRCRLGRLNPTEVWEYLATRTMYAGGDERMIFSPGAALAMAAYCNGIPRLLNVVADNCLLAAYAKNAATVDEELVEQVAQHLELKRGVLPAGPGHRLSCDLLRASSSWKEIVGDVRKGRAPEAVLRFVDGLRTPEHENLLAKAIAAEAN